MQKRLFHGPIHTVNTPVNLVVFLAKAEGGLVSPLLIDTSIFMSKRPNEFWFLVICTMWLPELFEI